MTNLFINHNILVMVYLFYPKDKIVMQVLTYIIEELSWNFLSFIHSLATLNLGKKGYKFLVY